MLIDIDDALLARHQELLMELIEANNGKIQMGSQLERAKNFEKEGIVMEIINITTIAYYKRDDNENNT